MDRRTGLSRLLPRLPADLAAIVALTLITAVVVLAPLLRETVLRPVLGLGFVLFAPGYAVVGALFPRRGDRSAADADAGVDRRGLTGFERVALAIVTSALLASLAGIALSLVPSGVRMLPIVVCLVVSTLGATAVAAVRRSRLPSEARLAVSTPGLAADGAIDDGVIDDSPTTGGPNDDSSDRRTRLFDAVFVLVALLALASVVYPAVAPSSGGENTEFYLLTENESGELVAAGYPQQLTVGESRNLTLGIHNGGSEPTEYAVVVELQRVEVVDATGGGNATDDRNTADARDVTRASESVSLPAVRVIERVELRRYTPRVDASGTWRRPHAVPFTLAGERVRLVYLLYEGEVPAEPTVRNADRAVYLWLAVSE